MTNPFDFNAYTEYTKRSFAPLSRFNTVAAQTLEKVARYQYEVTGDYMNFGIEQLHAATQAKDLAELAGKQTELVNGLIEKLTKRSQDLTKIAAEAQAQYTKWFEESAAETAAAAKQAPAAPRKAA